MKNESHDVFQAKNIAVLSLILFSFIAFPTPRIGKHDMKDHQMQVEESRD
jgi:hypothetical protein